MIAGRNLAVHIPYALQIYIAELHYTCLPGHRRSFSACAFPICPEADTSLRPIAVTLEA
ncbi:hypothetical protein CLDAP_09340 [Caldilinea aerophila DSM 14535 = NBRC 104270]|jgi:hypothetical protein|uniref:Uncharacterized protein n=1 Tax=Caldilinea aerophila (strain DSM 14535 / JCM 11387 / NBRC 104270 / STL-6-O1) TaxID=926550 RepID=I0I136_CALAS|nr:hypothetical protein CLDAP_09340 [Caldilinea aerophila DSM 14535 = NBRC 104270]